LHFLQIPFLRQFTLSEDIFDVAADYAGIPLEQLPHLFLGKPDRISIEGHVNLGEAVIGLVHDEGGLGWHGFNFHFPIMPLPQQ
jgi:hypothetical protein